MAKRDDETEGPLFRVRLPVITERFNPATRQWTETGILPGTQYTVVKTGETIDVQTAQPVLDATDIPLRALLRRIIDMLKEVYDGHR